VHFSVRREVWLFPRGLGPRERRFESCRADHSPASGYDGLKEMFDKWDRFGTDCAMPESVRVRIDPDRFVMLEAMAERNKRKPAVELDRLIIDAYIAFATVKPSARKAK
jgi:hypothetical protein